MYHNFWVVTWFCMLCPIQALSHWCTGKSIQTANWTNFDIYWCCNHGVKMKTWRSDPWASGSRHCQFEVMSSMERSDVRPLRPSWRWMGRERTWSTPSCVRESCSDWHLRRSRSLEFGESTLIVVPRFVLEKEKSKFKSLGVNSFWDPS